jgi:hypothetical protein
MIRSGPEAELYNHCGRSKYRELDVLQRQTILLEMGKQSHTVTWSSYWTLGFQRLMIP